MPARTWPAPTVRDRSTHIDMPHIYYFAYQQPTTGGDFVNIEHVTALRSMGFPATMLHTGHDAVPMLPPGSMPMVDTVLNADDWLVIPENEVLLFEYAKSLPCKVVVHNQNSFYYFNVLARLKSLDEAKFGHMICPSHGNAALVRKSGYAGSISVISPFIPEYFRPADKQLKIAYSPRKLPVEAGAVRGLFSALYPQFSDVPWVEIAHMSRERVAEVLGECAIYAAFSNLEAISLSVLEAMRSGCIVVGDHGGAGHDYAQAENGIWVEADEVVGFAEGLARAIDCFSREGAQSSHARAAMAKSLEYGEDAFREGLRAFWQARL
jgi:glycosyltransferase involved in cell wall biosynthesis